jgi:heterodisulfide reductase subunit B
VLLRPEGTAIKNKNVMEEAITFFGGEIAGEKVKDRCCGGNQFFANKWATEKLSTLILDKSRGNIVVFCPLCEMALKTFSTGRKILYLTDLLLYVMGENKAL